MVRRNPDGIASFSSSLISVVTGISGKPSPVQTVPAYISDAHTPTLEERELFFTDGIDFSDRDAMARLTESTVVEQVAVEPAAAQPVSTEVAEETATQPSLAEAIETVLEQANVESIVEAQPSEDAVATDLNISLADYLDVTPASEDTDFQVIDSTPDEPVLEDSVPVIVEEPSTEVTAVDEIAEESPATPVVEIAEPVAEAAPQPEAVAETEDDMVEDTEEMLSDLAELDVQASSDNDLSEQPEAADVVEEMSDSQPTLEPEATVATSDPAVEEPAASAPADVTESIVRAVLDQFEQNQGMKADPDFIRQVTEQVAAQMAAQQTAMRVAQQALSAQPVAPMIIQQAPIAQTVVPGIPVPGVPVTVDPASVAAYPSVVPAAPIVVPQPQVMSVPTPMMPVPAPVAPIPGFDPAAYLGGAAPAAPQSVPQYQAPVVAAPVWVPPTADAPIPAIQPVYQPVQQAVPVAPAPSAAGQSADNMHMDNMTVYASEATVVYEPTAEETTGPVLPDIAAFDPSAYLGMNAVPSLQEVVLEEEVIAEPTWEPVYEFAPVEESEPELTLPDDDSARLREQRKAQQMLRELSSLRDHMR